MDKLSKWKLAIKVYNCLCGNGANIGGDKRDWVYVIYEALN